MPFYIPGGFGQIVHHFALVGDPEEMAVTLGWSADVGTVNLAAAANDAHDAMGVLWAARGASAYTLNHTTLTLVPAIDEEPFIVDHFEPVVGGQASTVLPQNSAYLVHKTTGLGGRFNKGRFYLPGVFESQADNKGLLDGPSLTTWNTALGTLLTSYLASAQIADIVLLHNPRPADATPDPTSITTLVMDQIIATQRRRLRP